MTVASAKLTRKHQITIPSEIRRRLDVKAGDVVFLAIEEGLGRPARRPGRLESDGLFRRSDEGSRLRAV